MRRLAAVFRDPHIAEEAVQEAFARALLRGRLSEDDPDRLEAWLCAVARNVARDLLRRRRRSSLAGVLSLTQGTDGVPTACDPVEAVEEQVDAEVLAEAIAR